MTLCTPLAAIPRGSPCGVISRPRPLISGVDNTPQGGVAVHYSTGQSHGCKTVVRGLLAFRTFRAYLHNPLGTLVGNLAVGFLLPEHCRPTLFFYVSISLPRTCLFQLLELLDFLRILIKLRDTNQCQAIDDSLFGHYLGSTTCSPSTPLEADDDYYNCATNSTPENTPETQFKFLPIHLNTPLKSKFGIRPFDLRLSCLNDRLLESNHYHVVNGCQGDLIPSQDKNQRHFKCILGRNSFIAELGYSLNTQSS